MGNKVIFKLIVVSLCCLFYYGCGRKEPQGQILAKINDYALTIDDFKTEMKHSPYTVSTVSGKKELLDLVVRRELLIQEAQRRGLDKNEDFMRTIGRYWKQTLVKEVLEAETQRLKKIMDKRQAGKALDNWIKEIYENANVTINKSLLEEIKE